MFLDWVSNYPLRLEPQQLEPFPYLTQSHANSLSFIMRCPDFAPILFP